MALHVLASPLEQMPAEEPLRVWRRRRRRGCRQPVLLLLRQHLERATELEQQLLVAAVSPEGEALLVEHSLTRIALHS
jgi:hypothetical protein